MFRRFFRWIWTHKLKTLGIGVPVLAVFTVVSYQGSMRVLHDYPSLCATCHVIDDYYASWQKSDFMDYRHTVEGRTVKVSTVEGYQDKEVVCKDCHYAPPQRIFEELFNYMSGRYKIPLEERRLATAECFDCHKDYDNLIKLTENLEEKYPGLPQPKWNPHKSHFGEVECRVCHKAHRDSVDFCSTCHGATMAKQPGWGGQPSWLKKSAIEGASGKAN